MNGKNSTWMQTGRQLMKICNLAITSKVSYDDLEGGAIMFRKRRKIYLEVNHAEWRLIRFSLLRLREKLIAANLESNDVDALLARMMG